ncbi:MAG TPA: carboxypeptidase regulatory-like domain-containing protein [Bryobacteraceae bacterium]|nr:carboxypeptidase regulatory-like domain-containing protein [Bryobacteraceae bacterium]
MNRIFRVLLLLACTSAFAQSEEPKSCSVGGTVTNSVTHAPIPRAQVEVSVLDRLRSTQSDATGKWLVDALPCGSIEVTVSRIGYIEKQPLVITTPVSNLKVELTPQVVLAGRVIDDQGDPIPAAHVRLLTSGILEGIRTVLSDSGADTNDLGEYRFAGLAAGHYILCATANTGIRRFYAERCLPGPPEGGLNTIQASAGYEGRFDFTLSPLPAYRVSGVVAGAGGATIDIRAIKAENAWSPNNFVTQIRRDGTFVFPNLPLGSYTLIAETATTSAVGSAAVTNADVENIQLRFQPRITLTANLHVISASGKTIGPKDYDAFLWGDGPRAADPAHANNESGESFTIPNVIPGAYHFSFAPPKGFYLKSATIAGQEIIAPGITVTAGTPPLEITIADDGGTIEGDVTADDAPSTAWIYLERDGQPVRNAQADAKGHFRFDAVPPGDYNIYAWDDNSNVEYGNPVWMQRYGKPAAVSVTPSQSAHVNLVRQVAPE